MLSLKCSSTELPYGWVLKQHDSFSEIFSGTHTGSTLLQIYQCVSWSIRLFAGFWKQVKKPLTNKRQFWIHWQRNGSFGRDDPYTKEPVRHRALIVNGATLATLNLLHTYWQIIIWLRVFCILCALPPSRSILIWIGQSQLPTKGQPDCVRKGVVLFSLDKLKAMKKKQK